MKLISLERLGLGNRQSRYVDTVKWLNKLILQGASVKQLKTEARLETDHFPEGHIYPRGTILLEQAEQIPKTLFYETVISDSPDSILLKTLALPKTIGIYNGLNCASFCFDPYKSLFNTYDIDFQELTDQDIRDGGLSEIDLLIVPGGPDAGESYYAGLGEKGLTEIRNFITNGGRYIGSCAGAYLLLTAKDDLSPEQRMWLNLINATDSSGLDYWRTGSGFVRLELSSVDHPIFHGVAYGKPSTLDVIYWEGPIFDVQDPSITVLATYKELLASGQKQPSWDISHNPSAQESLSWNNPLVTDRFTEHMKNQPAIIETTCGKGHVILFSFHPEFGSPNAESDAIHLPHLLILNSLYYETKG